MTKLDKVVQFLQGLDDDDLIDIHNKMCEESGCLDDVIYPMEEFDEVMGDCCLPSKVADLVFYGDFCPANTYFTYGVYLLSFDYASSENSPVDIKDIAKFLMRNDESFGIEELQDILDEEDLSEEDDES